MKMDGWYKMSDKRGDVQVLRVYKGRTSEGSVEILEQNGCLFEEVFIFTKEGLQRAISDPSSAEQYFLR